MRGGYGSVQLLPFLDRDTIRAVPKLFIAYSDNTSILSWLTCQCGISALHGPMLERRLSRGPDGYDESSFMALVQGGSGLALAPDGLTVFQHGETVGPLFGGTLTQLVGVDGNAVRVRSAAGRHPVHRGRQRAAVSDRPDADAAAPERGSRPGGWRWCSARCGRAMKPTAG